MAAIDLGGAKLAPKMPQWMVEHVDRYLASGGTDGHLYTIDRPGVPPQVPSLLLVTVGRKSGERFIFPLFYGADGGGFVVVASKGGAPEHPGWYLNLLANPEAEVQVGTRHVKVRARTVEGAERARLWQLSLGFWPPYGEYQEKAGTREIPVVMLDPVG